MKYLSLLILLIAFSCNPKKENYNQTTAENLKKKIAQYSDVTIDVDMSHLSDGDKKAVRKLVKAGIIADQIFWKQTSHSSLKMKKELEEKTDDVSKLAYEYLLLN